MILRIGAVALLFFALSAGALAGVPSGSYTVPFAANELAIWDISGDFSEETAGISSSITLDQDDLGKITGTGKLSDVDVDLDLTFRGAITAKNKVTKVTLNTIVGGQGLGLPASGRVKFNFEVDNGAGLLVGSAKGKVCLKGGGCKKINESAVFEISTGDGSWNLTLDLVPAADGKTLTGTGSAVLSNGRTVPLTTVSGKYNPKTDLSQLKARGEGDLKFKGSCSLFDCDIKLVFVGNAITAAVRETGGQLQIEKLKGKVLGQTLKLK